jgi:hypothetical protein
LGYFLPCPTIDDNLVPGMVKDLLLGLVCLYQISSFFNQGTRSGLEADHILDIWPVGRLPDDSRLHEFVILDKLLLHYRKKSCY